jgi:hypothetical protein
MRRGLHEFTFETNFVQIIALIIHRSIGVLVTQEGHCLRVVRGSNPGGNNGNFFIVKTVLEPAIEIVFSRRIKQPELELTTHVHLIVF